MSKHTFYPQRPFAARFIMMVFLLFIPVVFLTVRDVKQVSDYNSLIKVKREQLKKYEFAAKKIRDKERRYKADRERMAAVMKDLTVFDHVEHVWHKDIGIKVIDINNDERNARVEILTSSLNVALDFTTQLKKYFYNGEIVNHNIVDSADKQWQVHAVINMEY